MKITYWIANIYKKKIFGANEFIGNVQLLTLPLDKDNYATFEYHGTLRGSELFKKKDRLVFSLYHLIKASDLNSYFSSMISEETNKIVEEIPCSIEIITDRQDIVLKISKSGKYIKSDINVIYSPDLTRSHGDGNYLFIIDGDLEFEQSIYNVDTNSKEGRKMKSVRNIKNINLPKFSKTKEFKL